MRGEPSTIQEAIISTIRAAFYEGQGAFDYDDDVRYISGNLSLKFNNAWYKVKLEKQ